MKSISSVNKISCSTREINFIYPEQPCDILFILTAEENLHGKFKIKTGFVCCTHY